MIGYTVQAAKIKDDINKDVAKWLDKAETKTKRFRKNKKYDEKSGSWSAIKHIFMKIQYNKCGFCERRLESARFGKIEHDVEHYRPKNSVKEWPTKKIMKERDINLDFPTGDKLSKGYYLLAYNIENYLIACKTCNSTLKSNYFPIAGDRGPQSEEDPRKLLASEKPYIPYPLGKFDTLPENIIGFEGLLPVPIGKNDHDKRRANVTIEFFELDMREELLQDRAEQIEAYIFAKEIIASSNNLRRKQHAQDTIKRVKSPKNPHTNCTRSFIALYESKKAKDRAKAKRLEEKIMKYLEEN